MVDSDVYMRYYGYLALAQSQESLELREVKSSLLRARMGIGLLEVGTSGISIQIDSRDIERLKEIILARRSTAELENEVTGFNNYIASAAYRTLALRHSPSYEDELVRNSFDGFEKSRRETLKRRHTSTGGNIETLNREFEAEDCMTLCVIDLLMLALERCLRRTRNTQLKLRVFTSKNANGMLIE